MADGFHPFKIGDVFADEATPFPLYTFVDGQPHRWREAGQPFGQTELDRLQDEGFSTCFVEPEALEHLARFLEGRLIRQSSKQTLTPEHREELLTAAISTTVLAIYEQPNSAPIRTSIRRLGNFMGTISDPPRLSTAIHQSHAYAVGRISCAIGRAAGLSESDICDLSLGALLHDLGFSLGESRPSIEESEHPLYREHPEIGCTLLIANGPVPAIIHDAVIGHHERIDGSGFPFGLKGSAIPMAAQIVGLADALTTEVANEVSSKEGAVIASFMEHRRDEFSEELLDLLVNSLRQSHGGRGE